MKNLTSFKQVSAALNNAETTCLDIVENYLETISEKNNLLEYSEDPSVLLSKKYSADRKIFLTDNVQNGSIIFIDGPLIGGNQTYYTIDMVKELNDMDITPIFFVKNSCKLSMRIYVVL